MKDNELKAGSRWRHVRTHDEYIMTGTPMIKDPDTREWIKGVSYISAGEDNTQYIRTVDDFLSRFDKYKGA